MPLSDWVALITAIAALISAFIAALWGKEFASAKEEIIKAKEAQIETFKVAQEYQSNTKEEIIRAKQVQLEALKASQEQLSQTKEEIIKAKDAQIEIMRLSQEKLSQTTEEMLKIKDTRINALESELSSLRDLTPMKLREYFVSVKEQLEEYNNDLIVQLERAHTTIDEKEKEIKSLKQNTFANMAEMEKKRAEANRLEAERKELESLAARLQGKIKNLKIMQNSLKEKEDLLESIGVGHPSVIRMSNTIDSMEFADLEESVRKTKEILQWFEKDPESNKDLKTNGIHLSVLSEAIRYAVRDFNYFKLGFSKFSEYVQYLCTQTPLCIFSSGSEWKIAFRGIKIAGYSVLPDIEATQERHTEKTYLGILANGKPRFPLPAFSELQKAIRWVLQTNPQNEPYTDLVNRLCEIFGEPLNQSAARGVITTLVSSGCLVEALSTSPSSERKLCLKQEINTEEDIIRAIRSCARKKLEERLGEVKDKVFYNLLS